MRLRIIIVTPSFNIVGGVSNHYLGLSKFWSADVIHHFYGKRIYFPAFLTFFFDLFLFIYKIVFHRPNIIIINPSLRPYQVIRDGIYLLMGRIFRIQVITFFHGWDKEFSIQLHKKSRLFRWVYNKSSFIYVLAQEFKIDLLAFGITKEVKLTTTKVNDNLLLTFNPKIRNGLVSDILFLARIVEQKGIFILIEAFNILVKNYPFLKLNIVGDGPDLRKAKILVATLKLDNVSFRGSIIGPGLNNEFISNHIYVLPTYGEGMPTSVLEAMSFGMPVITRPVGGLKDFFQHNKMGLLVESLNPKDFASSIEYLIKNPLCSKEMSDFNYQYAQKYFLASKVARGIERDLCSYTN